MPNKGPTESNLSERWNRLLQEVDAQLSQPVFLHCLGGFVLLVAHGLPRPTGDLDFISVVPKEAASTLEDIAGAESKLAKRFGLHLQYVTIADYPEGYEDRLTEVLPGSFNHLKLFALEVHDLVLAKLVRNSPIDIEDVKYLASIGRLNPVTLGERYQRELRPYLSNEGRHDLTLKLWLEACFQS